MYKFIINDFEGPLDLLLHLVHQADVDIYDINLEDLTNQYFNFINEMEKLELNIASEYIVMAAELIELKSRALLPRQEKEGTEEEVPGRAEYCQEDPSDHPDPDDLPGPHRFSGPPYDR